jgi:hypothetical protein
MDAEETNSGVKKKGDIEEVARFAEEIEQVMEDEEVEEDSLENFETWRPRKDDDKKSIEEKTVETASMPKTRAEEKSEGVKKDISEAGKAAKEAGKKVGNGENPGREMKKIPHRFLRPVYSKSVKIARGLEEEIYFRMMVKLNPYFFDAKDFSVNLKEDRKGQYTMDVNVPDEGYRKALKQNFKT